MLIGYALRTVGVLLALWVAFRVAAWVERRLRGTLDARGVDAAIAAFVANTARWVLVAATVVACLGAFGIPTTSFAALIGAAGLAIGLAFQGTLSNVASGVMLLTFRPFGIGDVVNIAGDTGKVVQIGLFVTVIDTPDNRRIIVPNSSVTGGRIENLTANEFRRAEVVVGVDYTADLQETRVTLEDAAQAVPGRDEERGAQVVLDNLGDSAVVWKVRVWCKTADFWPVQEAATAAVKAALDAKGIGIPFPQLDVHLPKGD